jgi:mRNA interferase RelE/StbE
MKYTIAISEKARRQLRQLPKELRRNIGYRIELMREDLQGDVKKLKDQPNRYRLRVGSYRVMFTLAGEQIQIYAVKNRKAAYE